MIDYASLRGSLFLCGVLGLLSLSGSTPAQEVEQCSITTGSSASLGNARQEYATECPTSPRPDCDPIQGGGWMCSSNQIGAGAPPWVTNRTNGGSPPPPPPVLPPVQPPVIEAPTTPPPMVSGAITLQVETQGAEGWLPTTTPLGFEGSGALIWRGRNNFLLPEAGEGLLTYNFNVAEAGQYTVTVRSHITDGPNQAPQAPDKNNDVWVRVNGSTWRKVFQQRRGQWTNTLPTTFQLPVGASTVELSGRSQFFVIDSVTITGSGLSGSVPEMPTIPQPPVMANTGDLYALHYDVCPDLDDVHAMVANHTVLDNVSNINVLAAIGTCGINIRDRYNPVGENLFNQLHPDGINVARDFDGAVSTATSVWLETLNGGYNVLVAEGGQSDFTAAVVRNIPSGLRNRITVVQHAPGYNEGNTLTSNLDFLRGNVNYVNIANGNQSGNATANLASWQLGIIDPEPFVDAALDSRFGDLWVQAFNILSPFCRPQSFTCRVDFSDSVELLYLTDDTTTTDINSFAARYF